MDARAMLELQMTWGAGAALSPRPLDRFARAAPRPAPSSLTPPGAAHGPRTLEALRAAILAYECPLRATVTRVVLPQGPPDAAVLIVGEVPDGDADAAGEPYAGHAGTTLDAWLASAGLRRADALVISALPWRPPGARPPTAAEEAQARPFVQQLLALSPAARVLTLGAPAARMALNGGGRPGAAVTQDGRLVLAAPGVADCARRPGQKRLVWACLRRLRRSLDEISP